MYSLQTSTSRYNISLDPIDLKTIHRRLGQDDVGIKPLWTVPRNDEDYCRFEFIAWNTGNSNRLEHRSDAADSPTVTCYLCNIKVPSNYVTEHNNSEKHKLCLKIADTALQRVKDQMLMDDAKSTVTESGSGYYCEPCSMIVTNEHHENTEIHKSSTLHDKLLKDLLMIYIDKDNINNIDLGKSTDCRIKDLESNELIKGEYRTDDKNNDLDNDTVKYKKRVRTRTRKRNKAKIHDGNINNSLLTGKNNDMNNYVISLTEMFPESSVNYIYTHDKYIQVNIAGYKKLLPIDNFLGIERSTNMCLMCTQQCIEGSLEDHINGFEHMKKVMAPVYGQDCIRQIDAVTYYCILCACKITECDQTQKLNCYYHTRDKRHVKNARDALIKSNDEVTSDITKTSHLDKGAEINDNNEVTMAVNNKENVTFCRECALYVNSAHIDKHCNGLTHKAKDTISDISTNDNMPQPYTDVPNSIHKHNDNSLVTQVVSDVSIKEDLSYQMCLTSNSKEVHCKVCDVVVPNTIHNINDHTTGRNHKSKYNKLLISNKIKRIDNGYVYDLCYVSFMPRNELDHINDTCHQSKLPADNQSMAENNKENTSKTFCRVCSVYVNSADFGNHCNGFRHKEIEDSYYDTMSDISTHEDMSEPYTDVFHSVHNDTDNSSVSQDSSDASVKENLNSRLDEAATNDNKKVTMAKCNNENTNKTFCRVCAVYVNSADFGNHCNGFWHKEKEASYYDTMSDISIHEDMSEPYTDVFHSVYNDTDNSPVSQDSSDASVKENLYFRLDEAATNDNKKVTMAKNNKVNTSKTFCRVCAVYVNSADFGNHCNGFRHKEIEDSYYDTMSDISTHEDMSEPYTDVFHSVYNDTDNSSVSQDSSDASVKENLYPRLDEAATNDNKKVTMPKCNNENTSITFCRVCAVYVNNADFGNHCNGFRHKEIEDSYYDTMSDISTHEDMSEPYTDVFHSVYNDTDNSSVSQDSSDASVKENLYPRLDEAATNDNKKVTMPKCNNENTSITFCRVCAVYVNNADFGNHCNGFRHKEIENSYYDTMSDISTHEDMSEPYTDVFHSVYNDTDNSSVSQDSSDASVKENLYPRLDEAATNDNKKVTMAKCNNENTSITFCRVCAVYVNSADFGNHCNEFRHKEKEDSYYDTMSDISTHEDMSEPYTDVFHSVYNDTDNSSVSQDSSDASVKENLNSRLDEAATNDNKKVTMAKCNNENTSITFCRVCAVYVNSADFGNHCNEFRHKEKEDSYYDTMSDISTHEDMSEPYTDVFHSVYNDTDNSSVSQDSSDASVKENLYFRLDEAATNDNKKVTMAKNNKVNTSKTFCRVCAVYVNNADFGNHCNGCWHKERENSYYDTMSDISTHEDMSEPYTDVFHSVYNDTDNSSVSQDSSDASVKENLYPRLDEAATNDNKKVTMAKCNNENTSITFCRVCAVYVNSADFGNHCNGFRHKEKEDSYYDTSEPYTDSSFTQAISGTAVVVDFNYQMCATSNPKEVHCKVCDVVVPNTIHNINDHTTGRNHKLKHGELLTINNIKLVDNRFFCYYCNVPVALKNELEHISGARHQSKVSADKQNNPVNVVVPNAIKDNQNNNEIEVTAKCAQKTYCDICAVHIDTHNYDSRIKGRKHKQMASAETKITNVIQLYEQATQWKPVKPPTEINRNVGTEQNSRVMTESQGQAKQNVAVAAYSNSEQNTNAVQKKFLYQMKATENVKVVFCRVCNVKVPNMIQDIKIHVNGYNHRTNYTMLLISNKIRITKNGDTFKCNACKVTFTRSTELDHILGRNHQANVKIKSSAN